MRGKKQVKIFVLVILIKLNMCQNITRAVMIHLEIVDKEATLNANMVEPA